MNNQVQATGREYGKVLVLAFLMLSTALFLADPAAAKPMDQACRNQSVKSIGEPSLAELGSQGNGLTASLYPCQKGLCASIETIITSPTTTRLYEVKNGIVDKALFNLTLEAGSNAVNSLVTIDLSAIYLKKAAQLYFPEGDDFIKPWWRGGGFDPSRISSAFNLFVMDAGGKIINAASGFEQSDPYAHFYLPSKPKSAPASVSIPVSLKDGEKATFGLGVEVPAYQGDLWTGWKMSVAAVAVPSQCSVSQTLAHAEEFILYRNQ